MLASAASAAAVPVEWDVEVTRVQPAMFSAYRGETLELSARMLRGGRPFEAPLEGAALYWQTNGMGSAYWAASASCASNVLSAVWSPTNDVGAATYNCFIGEPGGSYRAAFRLRLLDSPGASPNSFPLPVARLDFAAVEVANAPYYTKAETEAKIVELAPAPGDYAAVSNAAVFAATTNALQDAAIESNKVSIASNADSISSLSDSVSSLIDSTSTVSSGLSQLAAEAAPAINGYARLYSFVTGSTNANLVVTNYQLTAEAEAARTHFDPSDPDLDFSTVPPSLRIEDASSGTNRVVVDTRDFVVWYWAQKIGGAIAEAVSTAVDTCRAWVNFTASGLENPIPDTLVIDVPNIWLMAGKTFEKHVAGSNACWVIRSNGVTMPISDNAQSAGGFLELTDAFGTPYIRFNKTENYFVDPMADGIEYDKDIGEWRILYSTTNCPAGGANAAIVGSTTYPGKSVLKAEDDPDCPATITWTGSAKNWVMHAVPKPVDGAVPKSMFFGAVVEVQGQDYIEYLRPMSIPHLLVDGVKIAPDIPASHPVGTVVPWKVVQ